MVADIQVRSAAESAAVPTRIGRLVREGRGGYAVCVIEPPTDGVERASTWVVVDTTGRIVEMAKSELIAIAKMQALTLSELSASITRTRPRGRAYPRRRTSEV